MRKKFHNVIQEIDGWLEKITCFRRIEKIIGIYGCFGGESTQMCNVKNCGILFI